MSVNVFFSISVKKVSEAAQVGVVKTLLHGTSLDLNSHHRDTVVLSLMSGP